MNDEEILTHIYNAFDPFRPLLPGDPAYVDCRAVRGDADILVGLGTKIRRSQTMTCQLYAGHRGAGKSTELLRLKQDLEQKGCFVVYFAADEEDIDPEDAQYTDILLACTRHLLEDLRQADPKPLLSWLGDRWQDLKELALTEVNFEKLGVDAQITQFAKLTTNIRAVPTLRHQIRQKLDPHTITLLDALNEFIRDGKSKLPDGKKQLVVIADNLDRIVPVIQETNRTNHETIFLDRCGQLQALDCHVIYTVPISLVYSCRATDLRDLYGAPEMFPMIMVQTPDGQLSEPGLAKVKEVIHKRIRPFAPTRDLDTQIFESSETLTRLCLMSGGHIRNLLLLVRSSLDYTGSLPIGARAVQRAITEARDTYRRTVEADQWALLVDVFRSKKIENNEQYRALLFNRCLLEYRYFDAEGEMQVWYDVHPLIRGIDKFKETFDSTNL